MPLILCPFSSTLSFPLPLSASLFHSSFLSFFRARHVWVWHTFELAISQHTSISKQYSNMSFYTHTHIFALSLSPFTLCRQCAKSDRALCMCFHHFGLPTYKHKIHSIKCVYCHHVFLLSCVHCALRTLLVCDLTPVSSSSSFCLARVLKLFGLIRLLIHSFIAHLKSISWVAWIIRRWHVLCGCSSVLTYSLSRTFLLKMCHLVSVWGFRFYFLPMWTRCRVPFRK